MNDKNWLALYNGDEPAPEPPEPEPEPEREPEPEPTTAPVHRQNYEPLRPRRGFSRQYRVRWQRAGRQPRSKTFARFGDAVRLARRLEVEETNPGRVWDARKGRRVTKPIVEWIALDMAYVLQATEGKMRPCECECGETFYPARSDQRYVDGAHRLRAFRARAPRPDPIPVTASAGQSSFMKRL
jgi:hypothetical protein